MKDVVVVAEGRAAEARDWASRFGLTITDECGSHLWCLVFTPDHTELRQSATPPVAPIHIDFVGGRLGYRRQHGGGARQPLARAVGIKGAQRPSILDCTAGLGRDALVLANLGCEITLLERSPVVSALLADGLRRALASPDTHGVALRMNLRPGVDAIDFLRQGASELAYDVIYLDPMYPHRDKSALVKKEMRALREVVGDDQDAAQVLQLARRVARLRVTVKRPKGAPHIGDLPPHVQIASENTRYDIYLPQPA